MPGSKHREQADRRMALSQNGLEPKCLRIVLLDIFLYCPLLFRRHRRRRLRLVTQLIFRCPRWHAARDGAPDFVFSSATQSTRRETSQENQTARQDRAPTHQSEQVAHRFKPNDASKPGPEPATCRSFDCLWRSLHYAAVHAAIRHSPSRSSEPVASLLKNGPLDSSNVVPHSNVRQG